MSLKKHFFYWILPSFVSFLLIYIFFSGVTWMNNIVTPPINREFGLLENLQLLTLIAVMVLGIIGMIKKKMLIEKVFFCFLVAFTIFIFLEETDYGDHYATYFFGKKVTFFEQMTGEVNVHNRGKVRGNIFRKGSLGIVVLITVIPIFFKTKINHQLLSYLTPRSEILLTLLVLVIVYKLPSLLIQYTPLEDVGLDGNLGEFKELVMYYMFSLYFYEIIFEKELRL